jgi:two-component system invasion response regulator UvrY
VVRVFLSDSHLHVRSALRLMLVDLAMQVVGEATDWAATLALAPATHPNLLLLHWSVVPVAAGPALADLRVACPGTRLVVLSAHPATRQVALAAGADAFISKGDAPDRVAEQLRALANGHRSSSPDPSGPVEGAAGQ